MQCLEGTRSLKFWRYLATPETRGSARQKHPHHKHNGLVEAVIERPFYSDGVGGRVWKKTRSISGSPQSSVQSTTSKDYRGSGTHVLLPGSLLRCCWKRDYHVTERSLGLGKQGGCCMCFSLLSLDRARICSKTNPQQKPYNQGKLAKKLSVARNQGVCEKRSYSEWFWRAAPFFMAPARVLWC